MCGPMAALAVVAIGSTIMGTISQAQGAKAAGAAQAQQAEYQARVNENNSQIALNNRTIAVRNIEAAKRNAAAAERTASINDQVAQQALDKGKLNEQQSREATAKLIGRQRAVLAANGVVVDQDSALDVTNETAGLGALDRLTIRSNASNESLQYTDAAYNDRLKANNFRLEAQNFATQGDNFGRESASFDIGAQASRSAGANAVIAGDNQAKSAILSGIGSVATKWYGFSQAGAFDFGGGSSPGFGGSSYTAAASKARGGY